jgi:hypothetical protein
MRFGRRPASRNHIFLRTTSRPAAINPCHLTTSPPYGRRSDRPPWLESTTGSPRTACTARAVRKLDNRVGTRGKPSTGGSMPRGSNRVGGVIASVAHEALRTQECRAGCSFRRVGCVRAPFGLAIRAACSELRSSAPSAWKRASPTVIQKDAPCRAGKGFRTRPDVEARVDKHVDGGRGSAAPSSVIGKDL